ncbi:ATP-binding cassette-type vacuolar membrane transporter Hmt1 [Kickxella alabastrina]|uniref:ATP-binding cassette-type vacuolar membrane transporter Hmt1 n=1 Tax=Kickxella alabastrina TaxID=61397 RepID=A0ACC1IT11_9FUNG|nr:ATP-binding cassette-type vacuolar membrane transporter Hmt1 [Kickxella alabastrina]
MPFCLSNSASESTFASTEDDNDNDNDNENENDIIHRTSTVTKNITHSKKNKKTKSKKAHATEDNSESSKIGSRGEILSQICNLLVWLLVAECLVHTMLDFALRQELVRRRQSSVAITLVSWLAFAQICTATSWVLQLRHKYLACDKFSSVLSSAAAGSGFSWTASREFFWLFSLLVSVCELFVYVNCDSSWGADSEVTPVTKHVMLWSLISVRIVLNTILVACAAYRMRLCNKYQHAVALQRQQQKRNTGESRLPVNPNVGPTITSSNTDFGGGAYGAIDYDPSSPETGSSSSSGNGNNGMQSPTEFTPLVPPTFGRGNNTMMDDSENQTEALRSGAKKARMYHQSNDYSPNMMSMRRRISILLPFMWPSNNLLLQLRLVGCILILAAGRLVNVLVPMQFKIVVDSLAPKDGSPAQFAWVHVLLYVVLRAMQGSEGILNTIQSYVWIPVGQNTTKSISVAMFEHMHQLSLRFHVGRKTGEILRVQDRGVTSVVSLLTSIVFNVIPTLADIVLACYFFSVMFDLYFGTIVLTTMSMFMAVTILLVGWRTEYRRLANYLDHEMEARTVDSLTNFETVKYYNAEKFEVKEYIKAIDEYQVAEWLSTTTANLMNLGQNLIVQLGLLAGALLSAHRVYEGEMTVGDFAMLLAYITQLYGPLTWFGTYYRVIQKNFIDMEKLLELFDEPIEVKDPEVPAPLNVPNGEIVFDNVSFSYDRQLTLKNVSFKVPAGSTVAIVGPSGSGKSTILRLLFRFYDVQAGRILIDGQDIRGVLQTQLRQAIGVVPQDTVLFNDSIRYNIAYGRAGTNGGVTMTDVTGAADGAHIHDRIMGFPDQYETRVGERGQRLSGGEKQRVAIARTLLKDPRIVCLDEATSALDTTTERNIQTSLRDMTQNRTTLIIAHRLSTIIHADQILIVKDGEIVERGTHAELIADSSSLYYDMWMKQLTDAVNASYDPILDPANSQGADVSAELPSGRFQALGHPLSAIIGSSSSGGSRRNIGGMVGKPQAWSPYGPMVAAAPLSGQSTSLRQQGDSIIRINSTSPPVTSLSSLSGNDSNGMGMSQYEESYLPSSRNPKQKGNSGRM